MDSENHLKEHIFLCKASRTIFLTAYLMTREQKVGDQLNSLVISQLDDKDVLMVFS